MKRNDRNTKKEHMFLKIWLRTGLPILLISAAALFLVAGLLLSAVEMLGGQRIGQIGTELALILSKQDLTDRAAAENNLRLEIFHMIGILFDEDGNVAAETKLSEYTGADEERLASYQMLRERLLEERTGKLVKGFYPFGENHWYGEQQLRTPQGNYRLCYAGVTSAWSNWRDKLLMAGAGIFALMALLTVGIARSYFEIYKKQQAVEENFRQQVNTLAHRLKTPMMVISGYSENLLAEIQTEKRAQYTQKLLENVHKMNGLVEEMLEYTARRQTNLH